MSNSRFVTEHIADPFGESMVGIEVVNMPGAGGACHEYRVWSSDPETHMLRWEQEIRFQRGPIQENGCNGLTQEVLLAIVLDRLRGFQSGNFACRENAIAITHIETALMFLQKRTRDRIARGVEGTGQK